MPIVVVDPVQKTFSFIDFILGQGFVLIEVFFMIWESELNLKSNYWQNKKFTFREFYFSL